MSDIELKRTIAQMDKAYTDACMDKRVLEGRIEKLIAEAAEQRSKSVDAEELLQAAERDLDRQDVEIAALKAANELVTRGKDELSELCTQLSDYRMDNQDEINSLYADNRRLRDVIVHQAAQLAGRGE